jgi:hypothetical protein
MPIAKIDGLVLKFSFLFAQDMKYSTFLYRRRIRGRKKKRNIRKCSARLGKNVKKDSSGGDVFDGVAIFLKKRVF